jgi:putative ABC transport system permease protein
MGATIPGLVGQLSKEFCVLVLIANFIAWPFAFYGLNRWLQNFAYRVNLSWLLFIVAGIAAMIISLITVSYQTIKAARTNPVEALRYE